MNGETNVKKILVVAATKSNGHDGRLVESLKSLKDQVTLVLYPNNSVGLSKLYNKQLHSENLKDHDIILFVHDDVYIDDLKLRGKLYTAIQQMGYDIVGLAGASQIKVAKPVLWHRMSEQSSWSGAVSHPIGDTGDWKAGVTSFGPWPQRCLVLDGLFLAVNLEKALEVGWKFNENYDFHHYDISSCIDANKKKLKLGTYPIWCLHESPGLRNINDKMFQESQRKFLTEYKNV